MTNKIKVPLQDIKKENLVKSGQSQELLAAKLAPPVSHTLQSDSIAREDLVAQQDMVFWAMLMFFATLATVAITAIGVWFVKRTLDATLKAVEDTGHATDAMIRANDIAENAQRPWLDVDLEFDWGLRDEKSITLSCNVIVKNIGGMPARNANFGHYLGYRYGNSKKEFSKIAKGLVDFDRGYHSDITVLPGGTSKDQELIFLEPSEFGNGRRDGISPYLMVTVLYSLPNGDIGQSSAWFQLGFCNSAGERLKPISWVGAKDVDDVIVKNLGYINVT